MTLISTKEDKCNSLLSAPRSELCNSNSKPSKSGSQYLAKESGFFGPFLGGQGYFSVTYHLEKEPTRAPTPKQYLELYWAVLPSYRHHLLRQSNSILGSRIISTRT